MGCISNFLGNWKCAVADDHPLLDHETAGHPDYFVDMIEQLAERARELGEFEVAVHLEATAKARRHRLDGRYESSATVDMSL